MIKLPKLILTPTIKQALISIFIGACIAMLTTLFEGLIAYLRALDPDTAGIVAGMTYYLKGATRTFTT